MRPWARPSGRQTGIERNARVPRVARDHPRLVPLVAVDPQLHRRLLRHASIVGANKSSRKCSRLGTGSSTGARSSGLTTWNILRFDPAVRTRHHVRARERSNGEASDADAIVPDDDDSALVKVDGELLEVRKEQCGLGGGPPCYVATEQDDARQLRAGLGDQRGEVSVERDQHVAFVQSSR